MEPKLLPNFESFTIEEEEGSGINALITCWLKLNPWQIIWFNLILLPFCNRKYAGGYGTVYRAQRKHDGVTLAIKCMI